MRFDHSMPRLGTKVLVVGQFECNKTRDQRFGRKPICVRTLSMSGTARLTTTSVPAAFRCECSPESYSGRITPLSHRPKDHQLTTASALCWTAAKVAASL